MAQIFLETRWSSASMESLIDLLACLEQKLWPENPVVLKISKTAEKALVSHWQHFAREKLPRAIDRELFATLEKDSWNLVVCTKKNFWGLDWEFSVGVVRKRVSFVIFWIFFHDVIIRTMSRNSGSKFGWILGRNMKL